MKNIFTESLESKLIKYSLAAGAVLFGIKNSEAQVIVASPDTTLTGYSSFSINFSGSVFNITHKKSTTVNTTVSGLFITYSSNHVLIKNNSSKGSWIKTNTVHSHGTSNTAYARPLSYASSIKQGDNFVNNGTDSVSITYLNSSHSAGLGFKGNTKYIGVKFQLTGNTHYGWIKIYVSSNVDTVKIISYAYESTANQAIKAGSVTSLPVELTTFTANALGSKIELQWKTATEVNDYGFEVQRSEVSRQKSVGNVIPSGVEGWEKIGFVEGAGNSNSPNNYSFIDTKPVEGTAEYRLKQIDNDGSFKYSRIVTVSSHPAKFELYQNYPNPFNPTTTIQYSIPKAEHVTLKVYDELGREVSTLVDKEQQSGTFKVEFNTQQSAEGGTNHKQLSSGIYFYRLTAGNFTEVKKLILLK